MPSRLNDWLDRIQRRHSPNIELGLERCAAVWARMGRPSPARHVTIVAGTNGKGSTVAGIEAGLAALGKRVGCYTSPHLLRYNERIRIEGREAGDGALIAGFEAVEAALNGTSLTYFEFGTLSAFATMAATELDHAVLEVGLGGRLDAVNIIDADLAVITPVGLDHQEYLGDDRVAVGREKAGVMRSGQTVVCSDREPPESIFVVAEEVGARLVRIGADFDISRDVKHELDVGRHPWTYDFSGLSVSFPISMHGTHQADNLAAAITSVLLIEDSARSALQAVAAAVGQCRLRGRLEEVAERPRVIVDVGHNPMAARVIRDYLDGLGGESCHAVLGMLNDKDAEGFVQALSGAVKHWYCAGLTGERGQTGAALAGRVGPADPGTPVSAYDTVADALEAAIKKASGQDVVLVAGSFHTAGEAIAHIE